MLPEMAWNFQKMDIAGPFAYFFDRQAFND
jgi:hypothetical protein